MHRAHVSHSTQGGSRYSQWPTTVHRVTVLPTRPSRRRCVRAGPFALLVRQDAHLLDRALPPLSMRHGQSGIHSRNQTPVMRLSQLLAVSHAALCGVVARVWRLMFAHVYWHCAREPSSSAATLSRIPSANISLQRSGACTALPADPTYRPIPLTGRSHLPADPTNRPIPCTTCGDRSPAPVRTSSGPRVRCKLLCERRARPRVRRLRSCARVRTSCARASECGPEYTRSARCSAVLADA